MSAQTVPLNRPSRNPAISNEVLGMIIFILTEIMIFASCFSAYNIVKSSFTNWPPMGQPRLPVLATAFNSFFLMISAPLLIMAYRYFSQKKSEGKIKKLYLSALVCGALFFMLQGVEWIKLINFGLTIKSSVYGSFFYLIIGAHALHVLVALIVLSVVYRRLLMGGLNQNIFASVLALWLFVVGVWPMLYSLVYL